MSNYRISTKFRIRYNKKAYVRGKVYVHVYIYTSVFHFNKWRERTPASLKKATKKTGDKRTNTVKMYSLLLIFILHDENNKQI